MKKSKLRRILFALLALGVSLCTVVSSNLGASPVFADETDPEAGEIDTIESVEKPPNPEQKPGNSESVPSSQSRASFDYSVGDVPIIAQPSEMSCWSASSAMLVSWKKQASLSIESVMDMAGSYFRRKFDSKNPSEQGLYPAEEKLLFSRLGMKTKEATNYTAQGILTLLKNHGPIFVVGNEGSVSSPMIHARVITGISGDGTPEGTQLKINDPAEGKSYTESFSAFAKKYESVADVDAGSSLRLQIAHF